METEEYKFTYEEVKHILCEACKLNAPTVLADGFYHTINGKRVECLASGWRLSNEVHDKVVSTIDKWPTKQ